MASQTSQLPIAAQNPPQPTAEPPSSPQTAQRTVTCQCHCECGRHFASLLAFDLHRPGRTGQRKCVDPRTVLTDGKRRLVEKGTDSECRVSIFEKATGNPVIQRGVTVWQTVEAASA